MLCDDSMDIPPQLPDAHPMRYCGILLAVLVAVSDSTTAHAAQEKSFDVVVYSATPAGVFAAVAAQREGATAALVEPMDFVGGIMSSGLSFSDSNQMARECLGGLFEEFHLRIEKHYIDRGIVLPYKVSEKDQRPWTYEPHVAAAIFNALLEENGVTTFLQHDIKAVEKDGPTIKRIATTGGETVAGRVFIDASYEGDLMARSNVSYRVGREGRVEYGESLAGKQYPKKPVFVSPFAESGKLLPLMTGNDAGPDDTGDEKIMTYSFRMCFTTDPQNRVPITKPADYDQARYELFRRQFAKDPSAPFPIDLYPIPGAKLDGNNGIGKQLSLGLVGASWEWPEASPEHRKEIWRDHRSYTHGLLWFLANDEAVPELIRKRAKELGFAKDEFVKYDHWPPALYIREGRRMIGDFVLTQADILLNTSKPDPVAVGSFPIDSHDCQRVASKDGGFVNEGTIFPKHLKGRPIGQPHHLPYRCLLPKPNECDNLLVPTCVSATHVAFSSVRVEPTWMVLGQSSGIAAALISRADIQAHKLRYEQLKSRLLANKQRLELPEAGP
jgi:hypothetical protein